VGSVTKPDTLIDGISNDYDNYGYIQYPGDMIVDLGKVYVIDKIGIHLWDRDDRYFQYKVAVSLDGSSYSTVIDKSTGQWKSYQEDTISSALVRYIKVTGLYGSANSYFILKEIMAYESKDAKVKINSSLLSNTTYTVTGLDNGDEYSFAVTAIDSFDNESNYSQAVTETPLQVQAIVIMNAQELQAMQEDLTGNYYLVNDIDCSDTINWNNSDGFKPIGNDIEPFTGTFDGNGYQIKGLVINRGTEDYVGLFGKISEAIIQNVGVTENIIEGYSYVGGLVGYVEYSSITGCYSTGSFKANDSWVGSLVGLSSNSTIANSHAVSDKVIVDYQGAGVLVGGIEYRSAVSNCYAIGTIWSDTGDDLGVLTGSNISSTIENSYALGNIESSGNNIGGFVGYTYQGIYLNNFWNIEISNQEYGSGNEDIEGVSAKTTTEMQEQTTYRVWNFEEIWFMAGYPRFNNQNGISVSNLQELQDIRNNLNGYYYLTDDIDATETENWNEGAGFEPLHGFNGIFDGKGYKINNLSINRIDEDLVGLFGKTIGANIKNIGLEDVNVTGRSDVGALIGENNYSIIEHCYIRGNIQASEDNVGGLVGVNKSSTIMESYSSGNVAGREIVGGFIGFSCSAIYISNYWDFEKANLYQDLDVSTGDIEGIAGKTTEEMQIQETYSEWDFDNTWKMSDLPHLQNEQIEEPEE
ncbi:MAG: discoidin domain-containing protein, partial [Candidatus Aureabacteria bacterium]|nr:discoidin domain-containing protein [Candidatus Auribacterota bacterium]